MMDKKEYLSFTHGTMLQTLCGQLLQQGSEQRSYSLKWIRDEQSRLRRTQPNVWAISFVIVLPATGIDRL